MSNRFFYSPPFPTARRRWRAEGCAAALPWDGSGRFEPPQDNAFEGGHIFFSIFYIFFYNCCNAFKGFSGTGLLHLVPLPDLDKEEVMLGTRLPGPAHPPIPKSTSSLLPSAAKINSTVMFMVNLKSSTC